MCGESESEVRNVKLRKIIGEILPPFITTIGFHRFPHNISLLIMEALELLGLLSISITGMLIVSDEIPIRIIVERNEQEDD